MARKAFSRQRIRERQTRELAARLASFAWRLRANIRECLAHGASPELAALYQQAKAEIQSDLATADFADLLAQVFVSCCLLARYYQEAQESLPDSLARLRTLPALPPFVRNLLVTLQPDGPIERSGSENRVGELMAFLARIDIHALLDTCRVPCCQENPLISFYELFLGIYAPRQRSQRGVYYTPAPVTAYMIKAIDELLRAAFGYSSGLAGALQDGRSGIFLCDPACGAGAFLWAALAYVRQAYQEAGRAEEWRRDLPATIFPRLAGCELMAVPYLLAHIQLAVHLEALDLPAGERAYRAAEPALPRIFLANALSSGLLSGLFSREDEHASLPVILGNPPYAGHSPNHNAWIGQLLESYKTSDAALKKPGQGKWLSDDYVKFLRLAQWQVEQAGRGIVAFLTSHSYLDNPTFRGMRLSLLQSFDEIYILDLHGNSKKRALAPEGTRDQNIFTIQQGVAIGLFVKRGQEQEQPATVRYAEVWGPKEVYTPDDRGVSQLTGGKLGWLARHDLSSTPWQMCHPTAPFYLF